MKKFLTLLLIITILLTGCSQNAEIIEEEVYTAVEIETLKPMELFIENIMTAKAYADKDVFVIPLMAGKVEKINVKVGDRVQKDDVLFVMDKNDISKQVNQAYTAYEAAKAGYDVNKTQIQSAKDNFEKIKKLYDEGAIPETQYEQAKLAASDEALEAAKMGVEQARVAYDNAASMLDNAQVKAPIAGVVSNVNIVEGEYATSSNPPITIVDSDSVTVEFGVPANLINKISKGDTVTVEISAAEYKKEAVINSISSSSDIVTNLYNVSIVLENDGLIKPGMFAKVYLNTDRIEKALAVKTEAVKEKDDIKYVFVTDGNVVAEKVVTTGLDTGTYIEIKSGLSEGDKVIVKGQDYITDGSKVKVVRGE
ncbi:efflux RND transporter periplasmic adaptor subunit [Sedimentibacter sp.]|uniref:efflux RND transporter periplasmic adaptor subunit n=1 Tax=Sedimentibacter sp. TaxID=1960295 RepID=UPI00289D3984|nr:efflux RND transporter periplasmic adaptor subunit [Sedimentibacter sp.]